MTNIKKEVNEAAFEEYIENFLLKNHGYVSRTTENYDKEKCLDVEMLWKYLECTQDNKVADLVSRYGNDVKGKIEDEITKALSATDGEVNIKGVVDLLRGGIKYGPVHFDLASFRPRTSLNESLATAYRGNVLSVMRQVKYSLSNNSSIDMVVFLNGLPVYTFELKNHLTGQNVWNAIQQYKNDRDSSESLLRFKRCVAHFAVDTDQVFVTTKLADEKTFFLPFNKGVDNGAGNPSVEGKHKTYYLWEEFLSKDVLLDVLESYVHIYEETKEKTNGAEYKDWVQLYPRYHQYRCVTDIIQSCKEIGVGKNFLVQHSAGSGKSLTIAWLSYKLSELHDKNDGVVFDSVIVLTDRRVLNKQLSNTVRKLCKVEGVLKTIGEGQTSADLKEALDSGAKIITSTIHKFPMIVDTVSGLTGKKFAVVLDEAHSSQGGEMVRDLHTVLGEESDEDWLLAQVNSRQQPKNISYFAFTATPKHETLERFGEKQKDGVYKAFSLYSMKQAIEEKFILDVLQNYLTYKTYFKLIRDIQEDPQVNRGKALSAILKYVNLDDNTIKEKVEVIVTHFEQTVRSLLDGNSKAMIVTSSREAAVRYKLMLDAALVGYGLKYKSLVAFTGDITIDGKSYTEANMNGLPDSATAREFKKKEYKFLIVAEKYQTGFDEPYLCAMYVDRRLSVGPQAVQTLSRLNRITRGKEEVYVLDFVNDAEVIKKAFDPYYETTILSEGTDINKLNEIRGLVLGYYNFSNTELDEFILAINDELGSGIHAGVNSSLDKIATNVLDVLWSDRDDEEYDTYKEFLSVSGAYIKHYPFLSQVIGYVDVELEKLYLLLKYLLKKLPRKKEDGVTEILDYIDLDTVRVVHKMSSQINLGSHDGDVSSPVDVGGGHGSFGGNKMVSISELVSDVNKRWGTDFSQVQQETLEKMSEELSNNEEIQEVIRKNSSDNAEMFFKKPFENVVNSRYDVDKQLWEQLNSNDDLKGFVMKKMFKVVKDKVFNLFG